MNNYVDFFLRSSSSVVQLECFEVSHSSFSKVFRIVRNSQDGLRAKANGRLVEYEYCPCDIKRSNTSDDLEQSVTVSMAGTLLEQILPELDKMQKLGTFNEKPKFVYRAYRSDNLEAPMFGDIELQIKDFSFDHQGLTFKASVESLNNEKIGIFYNFNNFECMRSFI